MFPTANGKIPVHPSYDFSLRHPEILDKNRPVCHQEIEYP